MKRTLIAAFAVLWCCAAQAQSYLPFFATYGYVPTPGQWVQAFQGKQDALGYPPLNQNGGTMLGRLVTTPSTTTQAGLNIAPGVAPTTPVNGDMWATISGLYAYVGNAVVGPFISTVPASSLTGTTLASNVTASSLTSVGTLTGLTVAGPITQQKAVAAGDLRNTVYNTASGTGVSASFSWSTGTANAYVIAQQEDGNGSPWWQQSAGPAILAFYWKAPIFQWQSQAGVPYATLNATNLALAQTTASTSTTTGALTVAGGVGIVGAVNVGAGAYLPSGVPSPTTNALYNNSGALTWNGVPIAPLASPAFTGTPTAPTQTTGDNSTKIATDAFVQASVIALNRIATIKHVAWSSSGTYTPSTGMISTVFDCVGGGGGSGGIPAGATSDIIMSGAGGSGSHTRTLLTAAQVTADGGTETVTIGAAGAAGAAGANTGGNGGATSVGARLNTNGGIGGSTMGAPNAGAYVLPGSAGGAVGTLGDVKTAGSSGRASVGVGSAGVVVGGAGGDSFFAGGGAGGSNGGGVAGAVGSGGGAASGNGATPAAAGAAGGAGFCEQWEYVNQ